MKTKLTILLLVLCALVSYAQQDKPTIKVGLFENYIRVVDTSNNVLMDNPKDYIIIRKHYLHSNTYSFYYKHGTQNRADEGIDLTYVPIENISPLNDEFTANDAASFEAWYSKNIGFKDAGTTAIQTQLDSLISKEATPYIGMVGTYSSGSLKLIETNAGTITGLVVPDIATDDQYIVYFENGVMKYRKFNQ